MYWQNRDRWISFSSRPSPGRSDENVPTELAESTWCCGSAGIYNIIQPEMSQQLLTRKLGHISKTGASIVATANPGCHLQIENGAKTKGEKIQVLHPVSLLAMAYRAETKSEGERIP